MQNLRTLSDQMVLETTEKLVKTERETTNQILHYLAEVDRRRIFAKEGFPSLFEFCVKRLGYSEGGAVRRIQSMRLLKALNPEAAKRVEQKIECGKLTLSVIAQAASFIQKETKLAPQEPAWSPTQKEELLLSLEGHSARETERKLLSLSKQEQPQLQMEKMRPINDELSELLMILDASTLALLEKVKDLISHSHPNPTWKEVIEFMAKMTLKKINPARETRTQKPRNEEKNESLETSVSAKSPTLAVNKRQPIPAALKRAVWQRDQGQCQFQHPVTSIKCLSRRFLELDHQIPVARGGTNSVDNLSLRCRSHNQLHALMDFGPRHLAQWVPSLR